MVTIAEKITQLREEREALSMDIERIRTRRSLVNAELLALERSITPPKIPAARKPGDVYLSPEPAQAGSKGATP